MIYPGKIIIKLIFDNLSVSVTDLSCLGKCSPTHSKSSLNLEPCGTQSAVISASSLKVRSPRLERRVTRTEKTMTRPGNLATVLPCQ